MPQIVNPRLTLTQIAQAVHINVQYEARFSAFERHLAGLGLIFQERILVLGVDDGTATDVPLTDFPLIVLPVTDGDNIQRITRNRGKDVARAVLDEDPGLNPLTPPNALPDEIICKIRIEAVGIPPAITEAFTDQEVLGLNIP